MDTIFLLTEYGPRIKYSSNKNNRNAFHSACDWLSVELFDYLLENNDVQNIINSKDMFGETILHLLISNSNENNIDKTIECMDHLISKWHADTSIRDKYLNNILHITCKNTKTCFRMLEYLKKKCNCKNVVNTQNRYNETPIQIFIENNRLDSDLFEYVIYLIKECEADISLQDNKGWNTLFYVCRFERAKFIDSFLKQINCQKIINIQDKKGNVAFTQLMYNYRIEEHEIIELINAFIKIGMDLKITNNENKTLADIAKERKLMKLPDELEEIVVISTYSSLKRLKSEELEETAEHALQLLCCIAYLDPDYIRYDDLLSFSFIYVEETLTKLSDYSLIQCDKDNLRIKVHRTVQLVLRKYDLDEQNSLSFKTVLKTLTMNLRRLFLHESFVFKYIKKEEFKQILIDFYVENKDLIHLYFPLLARHHCDEILKVLLPKFKNEYNYFGKYNKIFTLFSSGLNDRVKQYYKLLNEMLFNAIWNKNDNMDTIFLLTDEYGARIEYSSEENKTNAFPYAFHWLSVELFDYLLENNDAQNIINSKNNNGQTILHLLVKNSDEDNIDKTIECMDHLISKWNAGISIQDDELNNILHTACENTKTCFRMLEYLRKKCNCKDVVNAQNIINLTPIQKLIENNYPNSDSFKFVVHLIKECKADTTLKNNFRWNILFYVCRFGSAKLIDSFLRRINCQGIINIQDEEGDVAFTQLMYNDGIEEHEIIELMKEFIKIGMDFKISNNENETLVDIAKDSNRMKLSDELKKII